MTPSNFIKTTVLFCAFLSLAGHLHGQEELKKERYIESNWGIALIDSDSSLSRHLHPHRKTLLLQ